MISTSFTQVLLMFLLMSVGVLVRKLHFFHDETVVDLTNILLMIVSPCLIIKSFENPFSMATVGQLLRVTLGMVIVYLITILLSNVGFKALKISNDKRTILKFSTVYSNSGFMGIPLVGALFSNAGVLLAVPSLALFNIFNWTHGVSLFANGQSGERGLMKLKRILMNPNIIAIVIGTVIFINNIKVPATLNQGITYVSNLNTPLAMMIIGNGLADIKLKLFFKDKLIWLGVLIRNIIVPLLSLLLLLPWHIAQMPLLVTIIMATCPVPGIVVLFALMNKQNLEFPTGLMGLSTAISIATIPMMISIVYFVS